MLLVVLNDAEKHIDRVINKLLDETYEELSENVASSYVQVDRVTKGIKITMRGKLFKSMSAEVNPKVYPLLIQIGGIVRTSKVLNVHNDEDYGSLLSLIEKRGELLNVEIRCEGHTDDLPLPKFAEFPSNWELSSARSLNLVRLLSKYAQLDEKFFSAMGYGEFRPIVETASMKNSVALKDARGQNRRVEIYLDAFIKKKINGDML